MAELSIGIGLFINMLFVEVLGITAGGMVVPGYIALHLSSPFKFASTVFVSLATFYVVQYLSRYMLIYGRRHLMFCVLFGFIFTRIFNYVSDLGLFLESSFHMQAIGMIVPGLIAYWMQRQGIFATIAGLIVGSVVTRFLLIIVLGGKITL